MVTKVKRGITAHLSGFFVKPPLFDHNHCWRPLEDFFRNLNRVKPEHWVTLLQFFDPNVIDAAEDDQGDRSMISAYRADMFIPSSPIKPWILWD